MKATPLTRSECYSLRVENDDRVPGRLMPTTMFLVKKIKLVPPGAFEAWLWRRWQPRID